MAIAKAGTDTSTSQNILSPSFSHTLVAGSDRLVVVSIGYENGDTVDVSTVTYGGQTMTRAVEALTGTSGFRALVEIWYIVEADLPADGTQTVQITGTGVASSLESNALCAQYTGVDQVTTVDDTDGVAEATPADDTIENAVTLTNNAWVHSAYYCGNSGTAWAVGQGQVEILDFQDASSRFGVAELRGAAGETSLDSTFSTTANRFARCAFSFLEAVVAPTRNRLHVIG